MSTPHSHNPHETRRRELEGSVLCLSHAEYYDLVGKVTLAQDPQPGELIECELCATAQMRRLGVI